MKVFSLNGNIEFIKREECGVVHFKCYNTVYLLNETAFFILNCADNKNIDQIVDELCLKYNMSDEYFNEIRNDCKECLDYLVQKELLHIIEK